MKPLSTALLAILLVTPCHAEETNKPPYNVLFIAIDDLRPELNCYGAEHIKSPNIDRLAASGVRFDQAHVQQAICMASRASIMSGIRPEKRGIYTGESVKDIMPDILTMNKFFAKNGYEVSSTGKIYHFGSDTKAQFGESYMEPEKTWKGSGYVGEKAIEILKENPGKYGPAYESADVADDRYPDGACTVLAVNKLVELKESGKPFFMAFGLTKPHLPFVAPQKYWDMYPEDSISLTDLPDRPKGSFKQAIRSGGELTNYAQTPEKYDDIDDDFARTLRRGYYACVSYADAQVGKVLDQLDELGLRENTIIVLWGDHGFKLGDYNSWGKWSNMDLDTRVPFIIAGPHAVKGAVCNEMVESLDLYPTLADLCGLEKPEHLEGKTLKPLLEKPDLKSEATEYVYSIWPDQRWTYDRTIMGYAVKSKGFNYVEWVKLKTGEVVGRELFDHSKDPQETRNVIDNPEYSSVVKKLAKKCQVRKDETDHDHAFKKLR